MGCRSFGVETILVGLHRVGLLGLREAIERVVSEGLEDRKEVVDHVVASLERRNYMAEALREPLRIAVWREVLRRRGRDFHEFLSPLEVTVRGTPGVARDEFVRRIEAAMATYELRPVVHLAATTPAPPAPELLVDGERVAHARLGTRQLEAALRRSITDW